MHGLICMLTYMHVVFICCCPHMSSMHFCHEGLSHTCALSIHGSYMCLMSTPSWPWVVYFMALHLPWWSLPIAYGLYAFLYVFWVKFTAYIFSYIYSFNFRRLGHWKAFVMLLFWDYATANLNGSIFNMIELTDCALLFWVLQVYCCELFVCVH